MIIAISGKAQAGKDTVAKMIVYTIWYYTYSQRLDSFGINHYNYCINNFEQLMLRIQWRKASFAEKLKLCLANILKASLDKFESIEFKNSKVTWLDMTVRELLQKFGTAIRNEICDDFWVKVCLKDYNESQNWIISDVRFKSEIEGIKQFNNITLRINNSSAGAGNHISEVDLDDYKFDYVINNNGSLEDLLFKVKEFCLINKII